MTTLTTIKHFSFSKDIKCQNDMFGNGRIGFLAASGCEKGKVGEITAVCQSDGKYGQIQDNCVLEVVKNLLDQSEVIFILFSGLFSLSVIVLKKNCTSATLHFIK